MLPGAPVRGLEKRHSFKKSNSPFGVDSERSRPGRGVVGAAGGGPAAAKAQSIDYDCGYPKAGSCAGEINVVGTFDLNGKKISKITITATDPCNNKITITSAVCPPQVAVNDPAYVGAFIAADGIKSGTKYNIQATLYYDGGSVNSKVRSVVAP